MLERQIAVLHPRLTAEIAIRASRHQVEYSFFIQRRIGVKSQVPVHEAESALPRHESANDGPSHRRRRGQNFRQVVSAPDRAFRIGLGSQDRDFLFANSFQVIPIG